MKIPLIAIGNSRGVRLPKALLEEAGFSDEVELTLERGNLILSAPKQPREGWSQAFKDVTARGDDQLLESPSNDFDDLEWQW